MKTKPNILVTGFDAFEGHAVNASWAAVEKLPNEIDCCNGTSLVLNKRKIPVDYRYVSDVLYGDGDASVVSCRPCL